MTDVLIDTDVFSFLFKRDTRAAAYAAVLNERSPCLCFMSVAEIKRWALQRRWGPARREALDAALRHYVILPFDAALTDTWARIAAHRSSLGKPIECGDCWIAATAVRHRISLVTHNAGHYAAIPDLEVITRA
jgi:predicted nucleic acid-binding protein